MEDEEKKRARKRVAVQIMASEDAHAGIMEFFRQNLGEPSRMLGLKNAVYVELFGDTMGQRLMRLNNAEWRRGEPLRMQVIFARMSLDEIVKYITVELKLNAKNEAHVQDRQGHGHRGHREDRQHREVREDTVGTAEEGSGSSPNLWTATTREDQEEAHFFAFVAHNMEEHGQDRSGWNRLDPRTKNRRSRSASTVHSTTVAGSATARGTTMHMTTGIARYTRMTRRPTSPPIPTRSPRSNKLPIGRQRAETVEKAKERAKGKAEEKAMVEDPAQTDA